MLTNVNDPFSKSFLEHVQASAPGLRLEVAPLPLKNVEGLDDVFAQLQSGGTDAVLAQPSLPMQRIAELALKHRLPAFVPNLVFPPVGGLMSYSADLDASYGDVVSLIDKIFNGRRPTDLPVQLPTKFRLDINLKTAKALGLTLPPTLITRADNVIE